MSKRKNRDLDQVVFYSYPKLIFIWPLLLIGPLCYFLLPVSWTQGNEVLGWLYMMIIILVLLTISVDIERNHAVFWAVLFMLFYFLGKWLAEVKGFTFFGNIYDFFAGLDVGYNRGLGLAMSLLLLGPYLVMLVWSRLQHKWRITHNEFEHYSFGRSDDALARGAKRVRTTYPDLLEMMLGGAGTLIVYSATGRTELRRIHHVILLPLIRRKINRLLEMTAVTQADMAAEESDTESEEDESPGEDMGGEEGRGDEQGGERL